MTVPNRAEYPARKQGDFTRPHDGSFKLQMDNPKLPSTVHNSVESAGKHASYHATNTGKSEGYKVFNSQGKVHGGGFGTQLSKPEAASYKEHLKYNKPQEIADRD